MNENYIIQLVQNNVTFVIRSLLNYWNEVIYADSSLAIDFGCDGLDIIEIIMTLETNFNISIDDSFYTEPGKCDESVRSDLTVGMLVNYCAQKVMEGLENIEELTFDSLPLKPQYVINDAQKAIKESNYDEILSIFNGCSSLQLVPMDTNLEKLGINIERVLEHTMRNSTITLSECDDFDFDITDKGINVYSDFCVFDWVGNNRPSTLSELGKELEMGWDEDIIELTDTNFFDLMRTSMPDAQWFCEENSAMDVCLNRRSFLFAIKEQYGINLNIKEFSQFNGTVKSFCEMIVEYINDTVD